MPGYYSEDAVESNLLLSTTGNNNHNGAMDEATTPFQINPNIWSSDIDDQQQHHHQIGGGLGFNESPSPNNFNQHHHHSSASSAMQQLAYELSAFNLNSRRGIGGVGGGQYLDDEYLGNEIDDDGSPVDFDFERYKSTITGDTLVPISASTLMALVNGQPMDEETENQLALLARRRTQNTTECVPVPSSEHVAEIVGRQGCKIKALRAKTNTYIKTPVRGEEPVFVVTGRRDDVDAAKREILSAADHFTQIRASRRHSQGGIPAPGHVTAYVRVPYKVVGLVVGPKGATIKRIQQTTHTYIITPSREKDPTFEVTGLPENVEVARKEIEQHIANRTGVYPSTTVGTPPMQTYDDDGSAEINSTTSIHQQRGAILTNDFHLNGVDTALTNTDSATTPDSTQMINGASLFSIDSVSSLSGAPYFGTTSRALSMSSTCNPFSNAAAAAAVAALDQRRSSADAYFMGHPSYDNNTTSENALGAQQYNAWCSFVSSGATNKSQGLPLFSANTHNTANSNNTMATTKSGTAYSHTGSDQDEGVWSNGGESPNSFSVEPLVSSCLGSIWSEVVGM